MVFIGQLGKRPLVTFFRANVVTGGEGVLFGVSKQTRSRSFSFVASIMVADPARSDPAQVANPGRAVIFQSLILTSKPGQAW